jgi:hypothetical protein
MSPKGDGQSRNDRFLQTLADELTDTPASDLLDGGSAEDPLQLAARLLHSSKEEAGRRRQASSREKTLAVPRARSGASAGISPAAARAYLVRRALALADLAELSDAELLRLYDMVRSREKASRFEDEGVDE